ncbi:MAG: radical SAM protein, partial [Spirochaetaceae bacterium]|nr:radical SAM protein [Spirochaetaceae bacterium]
MGRGAPCGLCPRRCAAPAAAYCGGGGALRLASATIHHGEEPPITGLGGSGTVFVTGCNLRCVFCQNRQISHQGLGQAVSAGEFAEICLALERRGAENINIVTGSHAVPAIVEGLRRARASGLKIPCLWNSSAYESVEMLDMLKDVVDMYLPDLKTLDENIAASFFNAPNYPRYAREAIIKMMDMAGKHRVIIRHLLLPGFLESTREVLRWFARNAGGRALLSLMTQYTPIPAAPEDSAKAPRRFVSREEYETALGWLTEFGIEDGFYQQLETGD